MKIRPPISDTYLKYGWAASSLSLTFLLILLTFPNPWNEVKISFILIIPIPCAIGTFYIRYKSFERYFDECLEQKGPVFFDKLKSLMLDASVAKPTAYYLIAVQKSVREQDSISLSLPITSQNKPWEGRSIKWKSQKEYPYFDVGFCDQKSKAFISESVDYKWLPMAKKHHGKKIQNVFSPDTYLKQYSEIRAFMEDMFPYETRKSFGQLLGSYGRYGAYPDWLQNPEHPKCEVCGKRAIHILQVDTSIFDGNTCAELYMFVCPEHPNKIIAHSQNT